MSFSNLPKGLIKSAASLLEKIRMFESSPKDPKIEKWIKENKKTFKDEYGDAEGERILYAKAWEMHNKKLVNESSEMKDNIDDCHVCECGDSGSKEDEMDKEDVKSDDHLLRSKSRTDRESGLPELGEDHMAGNQSPDMHDRSIENESVIEPAEELDENYASPEPSSAVGFRDEPEMAKSGVVLHDVTIIGGERKDVFRMLVTFPNRRVEIVPPHPEEGAHSIDDLLVLTSHIIDKNNVLVDAVNAALDYPSDEPRFRGNDKK